MRPPESKKPAGEAGFLQSNYGNEPRHSSAWAVVVTKPSGARVVFCVAPSERDADNTVCRLRQFGLAASVERTRGGASPGMTLRAEARPWPAHS